MRNGAHGDAPTKPLVLVLTGIGLTAAVALRSTAPLKGQFQVLAAPASTGELALPLGATGLTVTTAEDAVALLDRARAEQAHVVGLSFGGAIAQEIAIRYPRRVRSLVLASSTAGGELYVPPDSAIRDFVHRLGGLPAEEGLWATVPYVYAEATCRHRALLIGEDIAERLRSPLDPHSYRVQHATARGHDAADRLARITAPTLVMHGEHDRVLPLGNGRLLAKGIAGAKFTAVRGGAHAFPTDVPRRQSRDRQLPSRALAPASGARRRPVARAQVALEHLAGGGARKLGDELHRTRQLVARELLAGERHQLVAADGRRGGARPRAP